MKTNPMFRLPTVAESEQAKKACSCIEDHTLPHLCPINSGTRCTCCNSCSSLCRKEFMKQGMVKR